MSRFTFTDLAECAKREVRQRQHVYPRRVDAGQMSAKLAEKQIAMMQAIADHFEELATKGERLL